jgi:hypothetical protein
MMLVDAFHISHPRDSRFERMAVDVVFASVGKVVLTRLSSSVRRRGKIGLRLRRTEAISSALSE